MKVGFKRAPDKARFVPKAGDGQQGKRGGAPGNSSGISKKLAAAKAELAAKRARQAAEAGEAPAGDEVKVEVS